ncbi:MAG: hypothetical protein WB014_02390 [Methanosarcina sp.]
MIENLTKRLQLSIRQSEGPGASRKIATLPGKSWLRSAKIGSMNMLPRMSTIIACMFVTSPD